MSKTGISGRMVDAAHIGSEKCRVVRGGASYRADQGTDYEPGVSAESVGATVLWLGTITLPPGRRTKAHTHEFHESAFLMTSGDQVEVWTGERLQNCDVVRPGDYLFIPKNVLHVAVNRGKVPAVFIGARNEASAQESVVMYPEMDAVVP